MGKFSTAPIEEVLPPKRMRGPSERGIIHAQYVEALKSALDSEEALVVELDEDENSLTIRNRINRAAQELQTPVAMKTRTDKESGVKRVIAFVPDEEDLKHLEEIRDKRRAAQASRGNKKKARTAAKA